MTDPNRIPPNLRIWPGVLIVALQWLIRFAVPVFAPEAMLIGVMAGLVGGLGVIVWWLFFSRAPWVERGLVLVLAVVGVAATPLILHESVATAGMGILFYIYVIPVVCLALVAGATWTRAWRTGPRRIALVGALLLACGSWALVRTNGITGSADSEFAWRWSSTAEERLLAAETDAELTPQLNRPPLEAGNDWPGFRGHNRDSVVHGVRISTDWSTSPPEELWRRPIGPGWSSFAVGHGLIYTQEQRGEQETVSAYLLRSGEPVWRHGDPIRFWESNAGAGPRATPTLHNDRLYTFGATGVLNALDAATGDLIWSKDVSVDAGVETPMWGFSSSPLVADELVIVAAEGRLAAYDRADGELRWTGPEGAFGYSSPHLLTIDGVEQILLLDSTGLVSVEPATGQLLWDYPWEGSARVAQPAVTANGDLILSAGESTGSRRVTVSSTSGAWIVEERWDSTRFKPYFSDFVIHRDHAYGADGSILACFDLADGKRKWKGGRYGQGQLLLLADQDLLLIVTERGDLALVSATSDEFVELGRVPAIEGKTWNHPVLIGDVLLVRNGQEMVAFRLGKES